MRSLATITACLGFLVATASPSLASSSSSTVSSAYHFDERSGILTQYGPSTLAARDASTTFTATFGLMLERDAAADPYAHRFEKRTPDTHKRARDVLGGGGREAVEVAFTKRGELVLPDSVLAKRDGTRQQRKTNKNKNKKKKNKHAKDNKVKNHKSPKMNKVARSTKSTTTHGIQKSLIKLAASIPKISAYITWYTGVDLQKPYCADKSGWTPKDSSLIAAVTLDWGKGRPACGSFLQLKSPSNKKSVIVRLVDMCGGCASGIPHVDLSKAAFQALYSLDVGKVADIEVSTLSGPPFSTWTSQLKALYGPEVL
ncbi:hypothetical protein JCM11491_000427 [Sporobolomyces phaffii]